MVPNPYKKFLFLLNPIIWRRLREDLCIGEEDLDQRNLQGSSLKIKLAMEQGILHYLLINDSNMRLVLKTCSKIIFLGEDFINFLTIGIRAI